MYTAKVSTIIIIINITYIKLGRPEAVTDLQGHQLDHCCIVFSWSPPFTLGQLSVWYQVILSVGEEVMSLEVIYTTNYTYCPIDLTNVEYRLNITTMNGAGTGIWNSNTTMFKTGNVYQIVKLITIDLFIVPKLLCSSNIISICCNIHIIIN